MVMLLIIKGIANALTHTTYAVIFAREDDDDDTPDRILCRVPC